MARPSRGLKPVPNNNIFLESQKPRANRAIVPYIPFKNNL
jgi:hypothetical protein